MKKRKLVAVPVICVLTVAFLYRHVQTGKEIRTTNEGGQTVCTVSKTESMEKVEFPTTYKKDVSDTLCFDAEVVVPEGVNVNELYQGTAVDAPLEKEKIYQYLFRDSTNVKWEYSTEEDSAMNRQGKPCKWESAEDKNGKYIFLEENFYLSFTDDPEYLYIDNCIQSDRRGGADNLDAYSATNNLTFMDRNNAKKEVEQALLEMGIETDGNQCTAYAIDLESIKEQEKLLSQEGVIDASEMNPAWEKSQEGYYFYMTQTFQGLPVYASTEVNRGIWENPAESPLQVYYNSHGLTGITLMNYFKMEKSDEKIHLASFDKIVDTVEEKYADIINTSKLNVKRMELLEFPLYKKDGIYQMTPVWMCYLQATDKNGDNPETLYIQMPIYADTAKEAMEIER